MRRSRPDNKGRAAAARDSCGRAGDGQGRGLCAAGEAPAPAPGGAAGAFGRGPRGTIMLHSSAARHDDTVAVGLAAVEDLKVEGGAGGAGRRHEHKAQVEPVGRTWRSGSGGSSSSSSMRATPGGQGGLPAARRRRTLHNVPHAVAQHVPDTTAATCITTQRHQQRQARAAELEAQHASHSAGARRGRRTRRRSEGATPDVCSAASTHVFNLLQRVVGGHGSNVHHLLAAGGRRGGKQGSGDTPCLL